MPMGLECIITGCALVTGDEQWYYWGDLHIMSDDRRPGVLIFNAVRGPNGQANVFQGHPSDTRAGAMIVTVPSRATVFNRNSVLVFDVAWATFNEETQMHLVCGPNGDAILSSPVEK